MKKPKSTKRNFIDDFFDLVNFMSPSQTLLDLSKLIAKVNNLLENIKVKKDNEENEENDKKENLNIPSVIFSLFSVWIFVLKTLLSSRLGRLILVIALLGAFIMPIVGYYLGI